MDEFRNLLLDVWREACRHIEIERSTQTIARILAQRMPIDHLRVLSLDLEQHQIAVAAQVPELNPASAPSRPRTVSPAEARLLHAWARSREVILHHAGHALHDVIRLLVDEEADSTWLAVPLVGEDGPVGALVGRAAAPDGFDSLHARMAESLIEPFTAVLENDRRLRELQALREAAEADKRSALSRLGRDGLVGSIVGSDGGLRAVMQRVALVARSDVPALILGETGTGKEVIARAIHDQSPRARAPFIRVNCGAIPPELIDSELFGHEKGAFTGAGATRRGWFERANEGTLLLDEIGDLPLAAQVRLLRVLQEGTFERVGAEQALHVNVRIVAATHRDLPAMVQDGRFREDLWYRIAAFPIVLPPLRERKPDIPALAVHFAQRAARRFGLRPQTPTAADLALLAAYDWPGNIRELASVIDRAAILGDGRRLALAQALGGPPHAQAAPIPPSGPAVAPEPQPSAPMSLDANMPPFAGPLTLDQAMRRHIEAALAATRGRIEGDRGAARLLAINPHTLRARMRKLHIDWPRFRC